MNPRPHTEQGGFPYRWNWRQKPEWDRGTPPRLFDRDRKDEPCEVLARGNMNSCLVVFPDGYRVVTSRNGIRKRVVRYG